MRFRIDWTEIQGYYATVEADSKEEALEMFHSGDASVPEATDFCETEVDSIEVSEDNDKT